MNDIYIDTPLDVFEEVVRTALDVYREEDNGWRLQLNHQQCTHDTFIERVAGEYSLYMGFNVHLVCYIME